MERFSDKKFINLFLVLKIPLWDYLAVFLRVIDFTFIVYCKELFLFTALIFNILVRKKFCKVSNFSVKNGKLSFGSSLWCFSAWVEISKSIVQIKFPNQ